MDQDKAEAKDSRDSRFTKPAASTAAATSDSSADFTRVSAAGRVAPEAVRPLPPAPSPSTTTQAEFAHRFETLTLSMVELVKAKNSDYAGDADAFANLRRHGLLGVLVRMDDKISRLNNYVSGQRLQVKSESAADTAMDLANYALIFVLMLREQMKPSDIYA